VGGAGQRTTKRFFARSQRTVGHVAVETTGDVDRAAVRAERGELIRRAVGIGETDLARAGIEDRQEAALRGTRRRHAPYRLTQSITCRSARSSSVWKRGFTAGSKSSSGSGSAA